MFNRLVCWQPTLLEGLFDDNWRIRQSSTMLVGDLLFYFLDKEEKKENQRRGGRPSPLSLHFSGQRQELTTIVCVNSLQQQPGW